MLDLLRGRRLEFVSPLTLDDLNGRLAREVTAAVWRVTETRPQTFEGTVADGRFRMMRLVHGHNSFRPVITGQLVPQPIGTRIDVQLRLHPAVVILCAILLTIGGALTAIVASDAEARDAVPLPVIALVVGLVCAVFIGASVLEARKATRLLSQLFGAPPSPPAAPGPG